jgi:hypothetical protein
MFQDTDLQNLTNFGHRECHHFEFQSSGEWKSLKYRNEAGPTCQSQQPIKPLAPGYRSPAHARATAAGHAPKARAPPPTRSTPCSALRCPRALIVLIHCRPWAVIEANPYFASSLPACPPRLSSMLPCALHRWAIEESTSSTSCASSSSHRVVLVSSCLAEDYPKAIAPNCSSAVDSSPSLAAPNHGSTAPTILEHRTVEELLPDSWASCLAHQTAPPPAVPPRLSVPPWRTTPRWVSWPQCTPNRIPTLPTRSSTHSPLPLTAGDCWNRPASTVERYSPVSGIGFSPGVVIPLWLGRSKANCGPLAQYRFVFSIDLVKSIQIMLNFQKSIGI